ncbi:MAG: hypothetical protein ACRD3E_08025 [Terriglobales bacterium]
MSKTYTGAACVVYLALAGYIAYRGYAEHRHILWVFAFVLVAAAVARLMKMRRVAQAQPPVPRTGEDKVELFTKPKDF